MSQENMSDGQTLLKAAAIVVGGEVHGLKDGESDVALAASRLDQHLKAKVPVGQRQQFFQDLCYVLCLTDNEVRMKFASGPNYVRLKHLPGVTNRTNLLALGKIFSRSETVVDLGEAPMGEA